MNPVFDREFEALVEKFAELLTGKANPETVEKVKKWAIYNHIHKSMPALASHWNQSHPEAKQEIRRLFEEINRKVFFNVTPLIEVFSSSYLTLVAADFTNKSRKRLLFQVISRLCRKTGSNNSPKPLLFC
ncbi:MAG: hypothetical protein K0R28_7071 [Paenibacillus sp.]|nr:hypothetical protein [Paenibacillus sp.]